MTDHPTTGEIVVRDFEAGKIKDLAKHIDKLLNKELQYGIFLGKGRSGSKDYTGIAPTIRKQNDGNQKNKET